MKKYLLMAAALVMGAAMFTSCDKDDDEKDNKYATVTFEGEYFDNLIDNPQYGGALIYSGDEYTWTDEKTTLTSSCTKEDWSQWGPQYAGVFGWTNGFAISNYVDNDPEAGYMKQLSVPVSNGSKNFAVAWDNGSALAFADGKAHLIKSMDVCLTTYTLNNIKKNLGEGYEFKAVAKAIDANDQEQTFELVLALDNDVIDEWTTLDLAEFGPIKSVTFTFDGSDKGNYGLATPKYFAIDNIVVKL